MAITVHISPSANKVYLEHIPGYGTITLDPQDAYNLFARMQERKTDLYNLALIVEHEVSQQKRIEGNK